MFAALFSIRRLSVALIRGRHRSCPNSHFIFFSYIMFSRSLMFISLLVALRGLASEQQPSTPSATPTPAPAAATRLQEVVVTADPLGRSAFDLAQPVGSLSGDQLKQRTAPTLGETLNGELGVVSSGFTAGASRPIIRGLADNRVTVLNNGTDVIDVSNLSPDHAPSVDPLISQQVEVVRGAATILYGSSAIGGVVNILDDRIPTELPANGFKGELDSRYDSNDHERSGAGSIDLALGQHWVLHLDGSMTKTDDISIPGHALDGRIRGELSPEQEDRGNVFGGDPDGFVPNTRVFTRDFGVGLSYLWAKGYLGASFNQFLSVYGVPDDPEVDDPVTRPDRTTLDITKRQYSLRGSITDPFPGIASANLKATYVDYRHLELDGAAIGSIFKTNGVDSRLELVHDPIGLFEGSVGAQVLYRNLSVGGDESFLQPTHTLQAAGFVFEEVKLAPVPVRLQVGGRVEYVGVKIDSDDPALTSLEPGEATHHDFLPVSAAAGAIYDFAKDVNAALTVRYSERAPTAEELFARGSHDATFQSLVGDPSLSTEKVLGVDLSLRKEAGVVTGSVSVFYNHFFNFIDFTPTGAFIDDLRVFDYAPKRADFDGGEALLDFHLLPREITIPASVSDGKTVKDLVAPGGGTTAPNPNDFYFELKSDYVHAEDATDDEPLPRIPPWRWTAALDYESPRIGARVEVVRVDGQGRTAEFEPSTPAYTLLNASTSYTFTCGPVTYNAYVRGDNLLNAEAREHTSFLNEVLPLPGRSIVVGVRATF